MGARISFTNHIHIAEESFENGVMKGFGYNDISSEMLEEIAQDKRIKWVQISEELPAKAYQMIDRIFEKRQDLTHITKLPDLSRLEKLTKIQVDNVPIDLDILDESVRRLIN